MRRIIDRIIIRPDGVQSGKVDLVPNYFDFQNQILVGGGYDPIQSKTIFNLFFKEMSVTPSKNKNNKLFNWATLTPHEVITIAESYHSINEMVNKDCVKNNVPISPIADADILRRILRTGIMSPLEVETKYSVGRTISI